MSEPEAERPAPPPMRLVYSLVRFVANPMIGDSVTIGVIVGCAATSDWGWRRIAGPDWVRALAPEDVLAARAAEDLLELIGADIDQYQEGEIKAGGVQLGEEWLWRLHRAHRNIVQFSEPTPMSAPTVGSGLDLLLRVMGRTHRPAVPEAAPAGPPAPAPALYAAVLGAMLRADPYGQPAASLMASLAERLTEQEARCLPEAFAGILPLLLHDRDRLRLAVQVVVDLDYHEAASAVADLASSLDDRQVLLDAAALYGNPATDAAERACVRGALGDDPVGLVRLDPDWEVSALAEELSLYHQCWPGARDGRFSLAPVVVIDETLDALAALRLSLRLDAEGATVRRLEADGEVPYWFGQETVLVCGPEAKTRVRERFPHFPDEQIRVGPLAADADFSDILEALR